ncbi:DUF5810 domain-containing protein [Haloprofundus sp. MHR1]|uniref:DUF5810 domain-containing protein n=1 Tax=Haloprofundus sp. MHR1 TaxID=2572921 RepID=UPI0010BE6B71|nr:DUF5810 domain-containing protein [Haloprofundus sp. MHR1]QCJ45713.1 hypothetical protein FCF25_00635 [Haloprofundus sp. MHR1]
MGYACPVCDVPQRDAEHLANHLAFTAMLRHEEHEAWLDEQIPNWSERGPKELAGVVPDHAEETEYDEVFEDTVGSTHTERGHQHGHGHQHDHDSSPGGFFDPGSAAQRGSGSMNAEAQQVLQEAQELTQQMLETDEPESDSAANEESESEVDDAEVGDGDTDEE